MRAQAQPLMRLNRNLPGGAVGHRAAQLARVLGGAGVLQDLQDLFVDDR